jgi:hypothetical protein
MPRPDAASGGILLETQLVKDASADTGRRIGGGPPIPHRLVGGFFPMP